MSLAAATRHGCGAVIIAFSQETQFQSDVCLQVICRELQPTDRTKTSPVAWQIRGMPQIRAILML